MNRGAVSAAAAALLFWMAILLAFWPGHADAMSAADIPAIGPQSVEVCERQTDTVCPIVTGAAALWVTAPNDVGLRERYGRIVRFVTTTNDGPGAWVRLTNGGELFFHLSDLTIASEAQR